MSRLTFPIGRLVWGSLYTPNTTDYDKNPLTIKTPGPDFGKPTQEYTFGVAIPKGPEKGWWETSWGQEIYKEACASFTRGEPNRPDFSWKIVDGDSTLCPKGSDKPINTKIGHAGHWVVRFKSSFPPKLYMDNGTKQLLEKDFIKAGYFIQVAGSIAGNGNLNNPGMFINHDMVNFSGYGEEISMGADPTAVGFGGALPAGATTAPVGGNFAPGVPGAIAATPALPQGPSPVGAPALPSGPSLPAGPAAAPLPVIAPAPVVPAPIDPLTQVPGAQYTIAQCRQGGWTDDMIVANGIATRGILAPAGVTPIPSFLNGPQ